MELKRLRVDASPGLNHKLRPCFNTLLLPRTPQRARYGPDAGAWPTKRSTCRPPIATPVPGDAPSFLRGATADELRVMLEMGPKGKKVVAVAPDWPGLSRGAKTEDAAIKRLRSYLPRYAPVAKLAGMENAFPTSATVDVVERFPGTGSTDFWGISFAFSAIDRQAMPNDELDRELTLLRACWTFFDVVRARVSAELQKGPRGGGRDRDHIVRHTLASELDWAKKLGLRPPQDATLTDEALHAHRDAYYQAIRAFHAQGKMARTWPLRFLIRHTAFHTMDHAWEMEDKDLTLSAKQG
jgi:hypothetical protein